jgi:hypothetical protein
MDGTSGPISDALSIERVLGRTLAKAELESPSEVAEG